MEFFQADDNYILQDGEHALWCNRKTGNIVPHKGCDLVTAKNPVCLGHIYGIIGKVKIHPELDKKLILIRQQRLVGSLPGGHRVYNICKIAIVPLSTESGADVAELGFEPCKKHPQSSGSQKCLRQTSSTFSENAQNKALQKTWNTIKTATAHATIQVKPKKKEIRDKEKFDKRITDELLKMFNDTNSFYYSTTGDITNSLQRQYFQTQTAKADLPLWQRVDERFFWNKHMLLELIESGNSLVDRWIIPIIQGYVQIETCSLALEPDSSEEFVWIPEKRSREYKIIIISRRSRDRAGTRYKRRGVDETGKCANYVETEQIVEYLHHCLSFVQVRGSVPVFWSQPGYKYRPPPRLDKNEDETQIAFEKHFAEELGIYDHQTIINLVERVGKEKVLADAYLNHILNYNSENIIYVSFDFHEYCRGMRFENVSVLISNIEDIIKDMWYCWIDKEGLICQQKGVFRVNCIDCLDRTNVVQTALAKASLEIQFTKLGLLPPEGILPSSCRNQFQVMWANNGDIISRQYAGTAALKGDFTRTGERRFAGLMKDGYNSANRYYMNRFKDAYRQATIDLMLGNAISEDIMGLSPDREHAPDEDASWLACQSEHVKQLIDDCKKILVPNADIVLGGWALIDADPVSGDPAQQDMDSILILTKDSYYIAEYDDESDRITQYQRVMMEEIEKIELGPEPSIFKSKFNCIRLNYRINHQSGYFHMFRSTNTRFFNNMAVPIKNEEEAIESLKAIAETFIATLEALGARIPFHHGKLERRKSKTPYDQTRSSPFGNISLELPSLSSIPRNVSETQLLALRNVGSKAISNMTSQIAKLNPMNLKLKKIKSNTKTAEVKSVDSSETKLKKPEFIVESSSEEEDEMVTADSENSQDMVLSSCGILATGSAGSASSSPSAGIRFEDPFGAIEMNVSSGKAEMDNLSFEAVKKATDSNEQHQQHSNQLGSSNNDDVSPRAKTPEITISRDESMEKINSENLSNSCLGVQVGPRKLSHSSDELGTSEVVKNASRENPQRRSSDQMEIPIVGMKMSHSESALGHHPPMSTAREFTMPGFSRFARGMQTLSANLGGLVRSPVTPTVPEDPVIAARLQEKRRKCVTRIIEL